MVEVAAMGMRMHGAAGFLTRSFVVCPWQVGSAT